METSGHGAVDAVVAAAVKDEAAGTLTIFAVNRDLQHDIPLTLRLRGFAESEIAEWIVLENGDLKAENSAAKEAVRPAHRSDAVRSEDGWLLPLHKASWNVIRFQKKR